MCRDRASAYAEAVHSAAPQAVQVADRFHLWKNLCEKVERCVVEHRGCLAEPADEPVREGDADDEVEAAAPAALEGRRVDNARRRHAAVHEMFDKGLAIQVIAEKLKMDRKTVRKYARAATAEDLLVQARDRGRMLQPWAGYLGMRWRQGCTDSGRLYREIKERGYCGSSRTVRRWLEPLRQEAAPAPTAPDAPSVRQVTSWLTRRPDRLTSGQQLRLKQLLARCPELAAAHQLVHEFAAMMNSLNGQELPEWIQAAETTGLGPLRGLTQGLRKDIDAVTAGLTLPWSSGRVEGHVNRLKFLKRQGYGRARFDLLRRRVLLTP